MISTGGWTGFFRALALLPSIRETSPAPVAAEERPRSPFLDLLEGAQAFVDLAEQRGARFGDGGPPDQQQLEAVLGTVAWGYTGDKPDSLLAMKIRERAAAGGDLPLSTLWDLLDHHKMRRARRPRDEDALGRAEAGRRGFSVAQPGVRQDLELVARRDQSLEEVARDALLSATAETESVDDLVGEARTLIRQEARERRPSRRDVVLDLDRFAERERALRAGREAGLPPREYELFTYFVDNPSATNPQTAQALGVAVGTIKRTRATRTCGSGRC